MFSIIEQRWWLNAITYLEAVVCDTAKLYELKSGEV